MKWMSSGEPGRETSRGRSRESIRSTRAPGGETSGSWRIGGAFEGGRSAAFHTWIALLLAAWLSTWGARPARALDAAADETAPTTVIMISLDGTRPVDVDRETLPTLVELAADGVRSEGLLPPIPANTFPSHVTLVTGVPPDRHGLVNNFFIDPERGPFKKRDIPSWIEVEPLWSWLERRGVTTASFHWVGSEGAWPSGRAPTHWKPFAASTPPVEKVETILGWLDRRDPKERPRFITSWFPGADHVAHRDGPGSATARAALAKQDAAFAMLREGIEARGLWASTTLIVVSDHGMVRADTLVDFDKLLEAEGVRARVSGLGGFANVYFDDDFDDDFGRRNDASGERLRKYETIRRLAARHGVEAILVGAGIPGQPSPGEMPTHPRFGDVVLRAPIGTAFYRPGLPKGGFHGYAPEAPEMVGLFIASGRGAPRGGRLGLVRAIDVAPTVLALLGFEAPGWMEGEPVDLSFVIPSDPTRTSIEVESR